MLNIIHVTHSDLDGIGCEVLSHAAFPDDAVTVYSEDYETVDDRIATIIKEDNFDILFITDISARDPEVIKSLNEISKNKTVRIVDHHMTSAQRYIGMNWARFTSAECGTLAFYNTLIKEFSADIAYLKKFAETVNDYDLWIKEDPMSDRLNSLFHFMGREGFVRRTLNYDFKKESEIMSVTEIGIIHYCDLKTDKYVQEKIMTAKKICSKIRIAVVFADTAQSQIGDTIRKSGKFDDCECTAIIDVARQMVSLRRINPEFNVGEYAKKFGGGGNPATAGFSIKDPAGANKSLALAIAVNLFREENQV